MNPFRILFIVTSATRMGDKHTGSWLEEVAAPYYTFLDTHCEVMIASPKGGKAPIDPESLQPENLSASTARFMVDAVAQAAMNATPALGELAMESYDALYFPGGHGTMEDFPHDPAILAWVEHFYAKGKPLGAVCHGPACLVHARKPSGEPLLRGHRFACFTDEEETLVGLREHVPFLLESRLQEQGGIAQPAPPFTSNVVIEGPLMTGQNPASAIALAEALIHYLRNHAGPPAAA